MKRKWPEDDLPPPKISQNHYRHIHEQRDFTLENLSMAGETDHDEYTDLKFELEYEWEQDIDIHEQNKQLDQDFQKSRTSVRQLTKKSVSPFYRFKIIDEERKKRKDLNSKKAQDLYGNFMNKDVVHGINEQDAQLLQSLIDGSDDVIRTEHKTI